jgi:hypothetical protein
MLNPASIGLSTKLTEGLSETGLQLRVHAGMVSRFDPGIGNHVYLTLSHAGATERVKVTGRIGDLLTIEGRGTDNTDARAWPAGTCVTSEWNPLQLCEFIGQCVAGAATPTGVAPQTVCMSSCACIDIGADGRITRVSGNTTC